MTEDRLTRLIRDAAHAVELPPYPANAVAARIANATNVASGASSKRRPGRAIVVGTLVLGAALAAAASSTSMTDAAKRTWERLTGHSYAHVRKYEVPRMSLEEAREHTTFPIVVPRGVRVLDAHPFPNDQGITLVLTLNGRSQGVLTERWAGAPVSKTEGVGVRDDGSIRRWNVRHWQVGRIAFSFPMFDPSYHAFADAVERATKPAR